jgi:hypothetical protein
MKALILSNKVIQIEANAFPVAQPLVWVDCQNDVQVGWTYENNVFVEPIAPVKTLVEQFEEVRVALQSAIDVQANTLGFSTGNSLMLYAGKDNPFRALADPFFDWEASVWFQAEVYKQQVIAGTQPMLTPEQAVAMIPSYPT